MSLRAFHIVFVAASVLLSFGFGAWAIKDFRHSQEAASLCMGVGGFLGGAVLLVYGWWFLRKLKNGSPA